MVAPSEIRVFTKITIKKLVYLIALSSKNHDIRGFKARISWFFEVFILEYRDPTTSRSTSAYQHSSLHHHAKVLSPHQQ